MVQVRALASIQVLVNDKHIVKVNASKRPSKSIESHVDDITEELRYQIEQIAPGDRFSIIGDNSLADAKPSRICEIIYATPYELDQEWAYHVEGDIGMLRVVGHKHQPDVNNFQKGDHAAQGHRARRYKPDHVRYMIVILL